MKLTRIFSNKNILIAIGLLCLTGIMVFLSYQYRRGLDIKKITLIAKPSPHRPKNQVKCLLVTNVQTDDLRFKVLIPCENARQKKELYEKMPKIKHELLMSMNEPEVVLKVKERKFEDFRSHLLKILNSVAQKPIKELYFESFFCD